MAVLEGEAEADALPVPMLDRVLRADIAAHRDADVWAARQTEQERQRGRRSPDWWPPGGCSTSEHSG